MFRKTAAVLFVLIGLNACAPGHHAGTAAPARAEACHDEPLTLEERTDRATEIAVDVVISAGILVAAFFLGRASS